MKPRLYKFITLIIGCFLIAPIAEVSADSNIGGDSGAIFASCGERSICYNATLRQGTSASSSKSYVNGFRVSMVNDQGTRLPGTFSYDYVQNDGHRTRLLSASSTYKYLNTKYTKLELISSMGSIGKVTEKTGSGYKNLATRADIPLFMSASSKNNLVKKYFDDMADEGQNHSVLKKFLQDSTGYKADSYTPDEQAKHYLLVEPLTSMIVTDKSSGNADTYKITAYFGTVTEVAYMVKKSDGYPLWSEDCSGGVTGHFGRMLPFSIYSETSAAGLDGVQAWAEMDGKGTNPLKCAAFEIFTVNGVAGGHVWIRDLIEPETCDVNPNQLPECCHLPQNKNKLPECCDLEENKSKPECMPDLCTFNLDISCPDGCEDDTSGYIKDIDDWDCIFNSRESSDPNIRNHFYKWGNQYCSIYCREDIYYDFPSSGFTVVAGNHFTIGSGASFMNWGPVHFEGRSECRTTSSTGDIRWKQFEIDWDKANAKVRDTWKSYQIARVKQNAVNNTSTGSNFVCDVYCEGGYSCGCDPITGGGCSCCGYNGPHEYDRKPKDVTFDGGSVTPGNFCAENGTPNYGVSGWRNAYYQALAQRDALEKALTDCNDWERSYDEFEPTVGFQYEEAIYGGNYYNLAKSGTRVAHTEYYINTSGIPTVNTYKRTDTRYRYVCTKEDTYKGYSCDQGSKYHYVSGSPVTYPTNDRLKQFTTKEFNYVLPANTYQYVLKPSGESVSVKPNGTNYVNLGYSNLPIHYSRATGSYDLFLQYSSFGPNHNFNKYIFDGVSLGGNFGGSVEVYTWLFEQGITWMISDCGAGGHHLSHQFGAPLIAAGRLGEFLQSDCAKQYGCKQLEYNPPYRVSCPGDIVDSKDGSASKNYRKLMQCIASKVSTIANNNASSSKCDTKYDCTYNVRNNLMCLNPNDPECRTDPEGIDVIYRTISLNNPFPGKTGVGRTPGSNWNSSSIVEKYITKNRNLVDPERIYFDREPMYEITLTPSLIKEIRSYNRKQSLNDQGGYADFELTCKSGSGHECKSDFIRSTFKQYFISNRCGMSSNWSACAESDNSAG